MTLLKMFCNISLQELFPSSSSSSSSIEEVVFTTRSLSVLLSNGEVVTMVNSTAAVLGKGRIGFMGGVKAQSYDNADLPAAMEHIVGRGSRQLLDNSDIVVAWSQAVSCRLIPIPTVFGLGMRLLMIMYTCWYCISHLCHRSTESLCPLMEGRALLKLTYQDHR